MAMACPVMTALSSAARKWKRAATSSEIDRVLEGAG